MKETEMNVYEQWALKVSEVLNENQSWVEQYDGYAKKIISNEEKYKKARKCFKEPNSLHYYLTIGNIKDSKIEFDIRYLGQSVGMLYVKNEKVYLNVSKEKDKSSRDWFGYNIGVLENEDWRQSKKAKDFRAFYRKDMEGRPRQREHMVESALFSEFGKRNSIHKQMCGIQPVSYANTRIHMKTALSASDSGKNVISKSQKGGEIDVFCRRKIAPRESRLVVVEVKDENEKKESFDYAIKQAISYSVFIRELIRSEAGSKWLKIWKMENQYKKGIIIDAVVAMPKGVTVPGYIGQSIQLSKDDRIEMHYIEINKPINAQNAEDVSFRTSM